MRNLKKLLAVVVAICVLATFTVPAFADTAAAKTDAQLCTDLGVLKGAGDGVTDAYLATTPTRLQGAIMFLRLKGLEEQALAFTGTDNFADVPATYAADSKAILAYLKAHPELGFEGVGAGNFAPAELMTAKQYYKILLVALGYTYGTDATADFTWNTVLSFGAAHGLSKLIDNTNFTVNDLAIGTIEALKATVKGGTETLVAKLAAADPDFAAKAIAAGLYTAPIVKPAVVSVKADNLREIVVTFNTALDKDSAEDKGNYQIDDADLAADDEVALGDDGKTVTITKDDYFDGVNQTEFDLTVSGVMTAAGVEMDDQTISSIASDNTIPVAEKLTLIGPNKFKVKFSEPMNENQTVVDEGTVTVNDEEYGVSSVTMSGDTATVTLADTELTEGNYTVVVKGYSDYAALKSLKKTFTLAYAEDKTLPTAKITDAGQKTVTIEFNKPVYNGNPDEEQPLTADFFYHTFSSYKPLVVENVDNGFQKYKLTFVNGVDTDLDHALPEGNVKVVVVADGDGNVTDGWGNELVDNIVLTASITADTTKPTVTKIETDGQDTLKVYFSEDVNQSDAENFDNYVIKEKGGDEVSPVDINYDNTDDKYIATFDIGDDLEGDYTIAISGIKDVSLNENKIVAVTKSFTVGDKTAPSFPGTILGVEGSTSDTIYVDFGENMASTGNYSVLDKSKYQYNGEDLDDKDTVSFFNGDKSIVKITIADETTDVIGSTLSIARVADVAGNKTTSFASGDITIGAEVAGTITEVNMTDYKTIEIVVHGAHLKSNTAASAFELVSGTNTDTLSAIKSVKWSSDDNETTVTAVVKANDQLTKNAVNRDFYNSEVAADAFTVKAVAAKSIYGTPVASTVYTGEITDKVAPSVVKSENTAVDEITLTFSEDISDGGDAALAAANLIIKKSNGDRMKPGAGKDYTVAVVGDQLVITLTGDAAGYIGKMTVASVANPDNIVDATNDNSVKAFSEAVRMTKV